MARVYVNVHPTYPYGHIIIQQGHIEQLKEYVNLVDWLMWDDRRMIRVSGKWENEQQTPGSHLERLEVVLQRIAESGDHLIFVRDSRCDEWSEYQCPHKYTEDEMYSHEIESHGRNYEREWVLSDIEKYTRLYNTREYARECLEEAKTKLTYMDKNEKLRKQQIKNLWKEERWLNS